VTAVSVTSNCDANSSLVAQADAELARRTPAGMVVFACLVPVLLASLSYFTTHRGTVLAALAITYAALSVRSWLIWRGGNLYRSRRTVWMTILFATVLPPTLMWDVFYCLLALRYGSDHWDPMLLLLCMVCTCFGALHSFTPNLPLMCSYQYTLLAGPVLVNTCLRNPHHWMIAAGIGALLIFITVQGKVLHRQYWRGLENQDALRKLIRQAEAASEAKSAFLANMSHEIRTPLHGLLGMIAVTLESEISSEQREQLELARHSGLLLQGILNDVLDLSKIEAGRVVLEETDFDLEAMLRDITGLVSPEARRKGLGLRLQYHGDLPRWFRGDPGKLRQIALNLIGNALKFTAAGEVAVIVTAGPPDPGGSGVTIAVRDTGIGITAEQQTRLFEKFSQADVSITRKYGGTGLGLVISKRFADLMGGSVGVRSVAGAGSTFWTTLPLSPVPPPAAPKARPPGRPGRLPGRQERILVVDDNPINQTVMARLLEQRGFTVDLAPDGRDAVPISSAVPYSLVFMDCQMPDVDGYQATREIRAREAQSGRPRTPVVAMTANAMSGDREACIEAGMDDYVSKPLAVEELERVLSQWMAPPGPPASDELVLETATAVPPPADAG
jgi:signal transduction histidine kinase/CheY-like chemotaxis protein